MPASYRPDPEDPGARPGLLRPGRAGALPALRSRASSTGAGRSASASATSTRGVGSAFLPLRAAARTTCRSRWRCATTATSSACTIPTSATAAASCSPSSATTDGPPARPRHQGLRADAVQPHRRRPADAQGRRARGARHRDARGARASTRRRPSRCSRPARSWSRGDEPSPTRSAVLTRLEPRPYPHRHLPAPRLLRRERTHRRSWSATASPTSTASNRRRRRRQCAAPVRPGLPARPPGSPPATSPRASSTACSTATISTSPARASTMARGASRPSGTPDFTAAYFDHDGLYAFGRQPEAIHWDLAQLAGCLALVGEAPPLSDCSATGASGSRRRWSRR